MSDLSFDIAREYLTRLSFSDDFRPKVVIIYGKGKEDEAREIEGTLRHTLKELHTKVLGTVRDRLQEETSRRLDKILGRIDSVSVGIVVKSSKTTQINGAMYTIDIEELKELARKKAEKEILSLCDVVMRRTLQ
ncbi:MAG: hypothetical protein HYS32_02270 [Candidatus Woesearchaeota archaeon]|nr:MAG: hypothetical protein HYS32_02270 [Candidatus Woesearchaeota archaeon]